jgi:hypothetical protein
MWRCSLLAVLVAVVSTGCQFDRRPVTVTAQPAPPEAETAEPPVPPPAPEGSPPLPGHKPTTVAAVPAPADAGPDPKQLVGLGFRETENLLGVPTRQEEKPPAKIWTYSGTDCELNIFFYADINTREFRALTYEVKSTELTGGTDDQCLAQLMRGT